MTLTGNKNYVIRSIDGLTPPFATVNSSVVAMVDGAIYNSARVETRNIIITISPLIPVEANRNALYKYFPIKKKIRLYYENGMKHVYIDGYVDSIDGSLFEISQTLTISIICLEPYWKSQILSNADVSDTEGLFEFPFAIPSDGIEFSRINKTSTVNIVNYGDVEIGMIIELIADDYVSNPTIYRTATGEMFSLIYYMHPKDKITINTNRNSKSIILTRNGEKSNIINITEVINKKVIDYKTLYKYGLYINLIAGMILNINPKKINRLYKKMPIKDRKDIDIKGNDIINLLNIEPSKLINTIYEDLENKILSGKLKNEKEKIKEYLLQRK